MKPDSNLKNISRLAALFAVTIWDNQTMVETPNLSPKETGGHFGDKELHKGDNNSHMIILQ
jgi:hypothetical protein